MKRSEFLKKIKELIQIKILIRDYQNKQKRLKKILIDYMKKGESYDFEDGSVECQFHKSAPLFQRNKVLSYIEREYGKEMARDIDKNCTITSKPKETLYVYLKN